MVITLSFKTPDVFDQIEQLEDELSGESLEKAKDKLRKWVEYDEYVKIDFDLTKGTAKVREV